MIVIAALGAASAGTDAKPPPLKSIADGTGCFGCQRQPQFTFRADGHVTYGECNSRTFVLDASFPKEGVAYTVRILRPALDGRVVGEMAIRAGKTYGVAQQNPAILETETLVIQIFGSVEQSTFDAHAKSARHELEDEHGKLVFQEELANIVRGRPTVLDALLASPNDEESVAAFVRELNAANDTLENKRPVGLSKRAKAAYDAAKQQALWAITASLDAARGPERHGLLAILKDDAHPLRTTSPSGLGATTEKLCWHRDSSQPRLLVEHTLPMTTNLRRVPYAGGKRSFRAKGRRDLALVLEGVPAKTQPAVLVRGGKEVAGTLNTVGLFAAALIDRAGEGPAKLRDECSEVERRPDEAVLPIAPYRHVTFPIQSVSETFETDITICSEAPCPGKENVNARGEVQIDPIQRHRVTVLAAVSGDFSDALQSPRYRAVGGSNGPDQLFQLENAQDPARHVSFSALLAFSYYRSMIGLGPTIQFASGGGAFRQINLVGGYELTEGIFFIVGVGLRSHAVAAEPVGEGRIIAVPRVDGAATPPNIPTKNVARLVGSLGLALDLSLVGDAATSIFKSVGGS